jgi:superfamily I DNA and/or RNA helicase
VLEVEHIAALVAELRRSQVHEDATARPFDPVKDLLIVAPYNAQVRRLRERLGGALRIASVDKFQGQEASVVIISMCASTLEDTPRGAAFLLSPNRLNVALSRARCLAIVVAWSRLIRTRPTSVRDIELMNLFCRLRFYAEALAEPRQRPSR